MDGPVAISESRRLFRALIEIHALINQLDEEVNPDTLRLTAHLVETKTRDFGLRSRLESQYGLPPATEWSTQIKNQLHATLCCSDDPVYQGDVYVSLGRYVEALPHYNRSAYRLLLTSHVNLLQKNYALIESMVGPVWQAWARANRGSGTVPMPKELCGAPANEAPNEPPNEVLGSEVLLNLALGYWCLHEYGSCLAVILHVNIAEIARTKYVHPWLSAANLQAMLFATAWLCLRPSDRHFLQTSDPVAQYYDASTLISRADSGDLAQFWAIMADLSFPHDASSQHIRAELRDAMGVRWLQQFSQVSQAVAISELGRGFRRPNGNELAYGEADLLSDLRRWELPYDLDATQSCLVLRTGEQQAQISRSRMFAVGEELATTFKRDALVSQWHRWSH